MLYIWDMAELEAIAYVLLDAFGLFYFNAVCSGSNASGTTVVKSCERRSCYASCVQSTGLPGLNAMLGLTALRGHQYTVVRLLPGLNAATLLYWYGIICSAVRLLIPILVLGLLCLTAKL